MDPFTPTTSPGMSAETVTTPRTWGNCVAWE